jgi:hypothetical protein
MIKFNLMLLSRSGVAVVPAAGGAEPAGPVPAALPGANHPHPLAETGTQIRRIEPLPFSSFCIPYLNIVLTVETLWQCCGSGMFIPDPNFFHPGSESKNLSILTKKNGF